MLHSKAFVKKTKKGKVLKVVREHYLRDDIYSGSPLDPECEPSAFKLSADAPHYLVIDTNIVLHQIDLLEHKAIKDVVVTSVVLEEVKARNKSVYERLRTLIANNDKRFYVFANEHHRDTFVKQQPGESINDRNDRAIRVAAAWYATRLSGDDNGNSKVGIILLTDDVDSRRKAEEMAVENLQAMSSSRYAAEHAAQYPELEDIVATARGGGGTTADGQSTEADEDDATTSTKKQKTKHGNNKSTTPKRRKLFEDHKPMSDITAGLKSGRYHQGALRVNRFNPYEGWVGSESVGQDVFINGREAMNRAMDGDIVAIEILPEEQWKSPSTKLSSSSTSKDGQQQQQGEDKNEENMAPEEVEEEQGAHLAAQIAPDEHYDENESLLAGPSGSGVDSNKRATGKVVGIIKRNWRTRGYCGSLKPFDTEKAVPTGNTTVLFCPVERKIPYIRIHTRQAATLADKRIVVVIDEWPVDSMHPSGHYVRTLGAIGDREVETEVVLIENDINTNPFTDAVHACVPPLPWRVGPAEENDPNRTDLRHLPVCSVDPPGCKDIDDALHVRLLPNGNYELGVHIADVTHFVHPDTAMDTEAAARATTTYLVQRRIDMLPKPLTEDICSLRADVDRLAFSVLWEMTPDAVPVGVQFMKSIIKSRAALTYAEAQSRIDDERLTDELSTNLRTMNKLAKILRQRRADNGALQLASPEVKFEIDTETHDPLDVGMYQVREANQMVEEMMLLANITVAERCLKSFPASALLRRHPTPAPRQFEPLLRAAAAVGITIDPGSSKALADSLDKATRDDDGYFNKMIRIMATRCMTQAVYFNSADYDVPEYHHYGLAAPLYTHFTSPIRRYADVIVHRVLMASLGLKPLPDSLRDRPLLHAVVDNLNVRHRNAQMAGRASVELHTLIFFKDRKTIADARITRVRSNGLIVFVPKYGIEGPVFLDSNNNADDNDNDDDKKKKTQNKEKSATSDYMYDEDKQMVTSKDGSISYKIFDRCAVNISVVEGAGKRRSLVLKLVPRGLLPENEKMG